MKKQTKMLLLAISLSLLVIGVVLALVFCDNDNGNDGKDDNGPVEYSIDIANFNGDPVASVIVTVFKGNEQVKIAKTNKEGKTKFELPRGSYLFELTFSGDEKYHYDINSCVLSPETPSVSLTLSNLPRESHELYNECEAGLIEAGTYYVEFSPEAPSYFLFTPTERGRYKLSVSSDVKASCAYYGSSMIIYDKDISNESDRELDEDGNLTGSIFMDFRAFNVNSTQYLFGVYSDVEGSGHFTLEKVADLEMSPAEMPYTEYVATHKISDFVFSGGTLINFDISNLALSAVYNSEDGYYHLNSTDGPVIYIKLTVPTAYTVSLQSICETQPFQHYLYDEEGKFTGKISYNNVIYNYIQAADETAGVYPLTEDLKVIMQDMGDVLGWYDPVAPGEEHVFFKDTPVTVNAWLFACCYVSEN